jgi:serine/threonine protein kinase
VKAGTRDDSGAGADATVREYASGQKVFGRYTLKKVLGRGGMGIVWLARDEELEREVALKFLPDLIIHDRGLLNDLKRETRRSLELTHKNIVRIYDFVNDERSTCISMEYIDGETFSNLRAEKERKVFEPNEIGGWTSQLCDALDYQAPALIERLLPTPDPIEWPNFPNNITLTDLRLRWEWDPLRSNPGFQKILASPEPKTLY